MNEIARWISSHEHEIALVVALTAIAYLLLHCFWDLVVIPAKRDLKALKERRGRDQKQMEEFERQWRNFNIGRHTARCELCSVTLEKPDERRTVRTRMALDEPSREVVCCPPCAERVSAQ